jgi:hypothetical protein
LAFDQHKIFIKNGDEYKLDDWTDDNLDISDIEHF